MSLIDNNKIVDKAVTAGLACGLGQQIIVEYLGHLVTHETLYFNGLPLYSAILTVSHQVLMDVTTKLLPQTKSLPFTVRVLTLTAAAGALSAALPLSQLYVVVAVTIVAELIWAAVKCIFTSCVSSDGSKPKSGISGEQIHDQYQKSSNKYAVQKKWDSKSSRTTLHKVLKEYEEELSAPPSLPEPAKTESLPPAELTNQEIQALFGGKPLKQISERSRLATRRLNEVVHKLSPSMKLSKTEDTGDCFYDAFAQGLSAILGKTVTFQELRTIIKNHIDSGADVSWAKKKVPDFNEWVQKVGLDSRTVIPVWGVTAVDGRILCEHFKVNLREISETYFDESPGEGLEKDENRIQSDDTYGWPYEESRKTVVIGNIPGHYFAVIPQ